MMEDSAAGAPMRAVCERQLPAWVMAIVSDQTFPMRTPDMTPFLRKLRADGAQTVALIEVPLIARTWPAPFQGIGK
jgi:hypothetical protein